MTLSPEPEPVSRQTHLQVVLATWDGLFRAPGHKRLRDPCRNGCYDTYDVRYLSDIII